MKKAKGIIFDFNGTLFFDTRAHLGAFKKRFADVGKLVPDDMFLIKNIFGMPNDEIYRKYFDPNATDEDVARFAYDKEHKYFEICRGTPELSDLAPGAREMLSYLKTNGIPFALATGSDKINVDFYIDFLGIDEYFTYDRITYADGKTRGKPYPDIYVNAAKKIGLDASECIVFEDAGNGFKAANAAGALCVIAVREEGLPSPIDSSVQIDLEIKNYFGYMDILAKYGLLQ